MTNACLEPIKTAIVNGDHAKARALRAALLEAELRFALTFMAEPMNFIDGPPIGYIERVNDTFNQLAQLGIQEES